MQALTSFSGTPEDLKAMLAEVVQPLVDQINELKSSTGSRKHAYKVDEVGEMIGFHRDTVLDFIHIGRKARNGRKIRLPAREFAKGVYRILPADLDQWLSNF